MPTTVIHKFVTNERKIALTFDDGPYGSSEPQANAITTRILDELSALRAKATFFLIGWRIHRLFKESVGFAEPSDLLLSRFTAEGHEVCNHTYHHPPEYPVVGDKCDLGNYMPDLPPSTGFCSWQGTIMAFSTAASARKMHENAKYWRSPHFAGTDPENWSAPRSKVRPQTNQTMVNFIYDRLSSRRPVTATAGLYIPSGTPTPTSVRQFVNNLKGKYLEPQGCIILRHQNSADFDSIRAYAAYARRVSLSLTTVGDVAAGATGDV